MKIRIKATLLKKAGYFSWLCKKCGIALVEGRRNPKWLQHGVAITSEGEIFDGMYDGYGRLTDENGEDLPGEYDSLADYAQTPDIYHHSCWVLAGKPTKYSGGSKWDPNQGAGRYNLPDPLGIEPPQPINLDYPKALKYVKNLANLAMGDKFNDENYTINPDTAIEVLEYALEGNEELLELVDEISRSYWKEETLRLELIRNLEAKIKSLS